MDLGSGLALTFLIIGILALLAEAASPGAFIIVPATVMLVQGGIGLIYPDWLTTWYAPVTAAVMLVPMIVITMFMYQKLAPPAPPETTVATSLVGLMGIVEKEVLPDSMRGKVRIANDTWSATSKTPIAAGRKVVVKSSEGVHVVVEELPEGGVK